MQSAPSDWPCSVPSARSPLGYELGRALDVNVGAGRPRALSHRMLHRFDVDVGRIVDNQKLRHHLLFDGLAPATPYWPYQPPSWLAPMFGRSGINRELRCPVK